MFDSLPLSGRVPFAIGRTRCVRLPLPFTRDLCLELHPHSPVPASGAASSLQIRHAAGRLQLQLAFAYNKRTRTLDYHFRRQPAHEEGPLDSARFTPWLVPHAAARCFKRCGRILLVRGVLAHEVLLVQASCGLGHAAEPVTRQAAAWLGAHDAQLTAPDCIVSEVTGSAALSGPVYSWPADALFVPLEEALPARRCSAATA